MTRIDRVLDVSRDFQTYLKDKSTAMLADDGQISQKEFVDCYTTFVEEDSPLLRGVQPQEDVAELYHSVFGMLAGDRMTFTRTISTVNNFCLMPTCSSRPWPAPLNDNIPSP